MKVTINIIIIILFALPVSSQEGFIINHNHTDLSLIPDIWIDAAKQNLKIRYFRRSHGSQVDKGGMAALRRYSLEFSNKYAYNATGANGELFLSAPASTEWVSLDFENDRWVQITRDYLDDPANAQINVVMWAWSSRFYLCDPQQYLDDMEMLINEYGPGGSKGRPVPVTFIFQTACGQQNATPNNLVFTGNQLIRQHCISHNRILFDFNDLECYDPNGNYYGDADINGNYTNIRRLGDDLSYNSDSTSVSWDNVRGNWGIEWRSRNPGAELTLQSADDVCTECAHSDGIESTSEDNSRIHCVLKGRAVWWLWARLAGWQQKSLTISSASPLSESNLNDAVINISLAGETFSDANLLPGNFQINGSPPGTTIESVSYLNNQSATIALAYNGTDFDSDFTQFNITIAESELSGTTNMTSNSLNIAANAESMSITANTAMNELNLNDAVLTVQLTNDNFIDNQLSINNIQLNNAPSGLTVGGITYVNNQSCQIALDFNGTDFDAAFSQFSITILAGELAGGDNLRSNNLNITAYTESMSITVNATMNELNLNDAVLTVHLTNDYFIDNQLSINNIQLNNAPSGLTVGGITYVNNQSCQIALDFNGTDFDAAFSQFNITLLAGELAGGDNLRSNNLNIAAYNESITISSASALNESNLADAVLTLQLTQDFFIDNQISLNHILFNNAPLGLSIASVTYINNQRIQIAMDFNGTDFDSNYQQFSITMQSSELRSGDNLISNVLNIAARNEGLSITPNTTLNESNLFNAFLTVQLTQEYFSDNQINPVNIQLNNAPAGLSVSSIIYNSSQNIIISLSFDGTDFDTDSNNFSITLNESELVGFNHLTSNEIIINCLVENNQGARLIAKTELSESNLDGSEIKVLLLGDKFNQKGLTLGNFIPKNVPDGFSFSQVHYLKDTVVELKISYTGSDFDSDSSNFHLIVLAGSLLGNSNLSTDSLTIFAENENGIGMVDKNELVKLFPNPSSGNLTIEFNSLKINNFLIDIVDSQGKLVYQNQNFSFPGNQFELNLSHLKKGKYFLVLNNSKERVVKSFILD